MQFSALLVLLPAFNLALAAPINIHRRAPSPFFVDVTGLLRDAGTGVGDISEDIATTISASLQEELKQILANLGFRKREVHLGDGEEGEAAAEVVARHEHNGDCDEEEWSPL